MRQRVYLLNGHLTTLLLWVAGGLVTLLNVTVGFAIKQHMNSDKEHRDRTDKEIDKLRNRMHEAENRIAEAVTRLRWINEDQK